MYVENFELGDKELISDDNLVYTQYNILTPTSRPSNRFGNVNFGTKQEDWSKKMFYKSFW